MDQPRTSIAASIALTCGRLGIHFFVLLILFLILCGPIFSFIHFFEQEETRLPRASSHTVILALFMSSFFHVIIPAFLLLDGLILLGLQLLKRPWRFLARLWFGAVLVAAVLLLAYCFVGVALPFDDTLFAPPQHVEGHLVIPEQ